MESTEKGDGHERSSDLHGAAKRGILSECKMGTGAIVQHDDRTPTGPRRASFFTHGTPGQGAWFTFMR
jgi:hypothetical protein